MVAAIKPAGIFRRGFRTSSAIVAVLSNPPNETNTKPAVDRIALKLPLSATNGVKWEISSDCSLPAEPLGIVCENGKPKFEY